MPQYFIISSNILKLLLISLVWIDLESTDEILISSGIFIFHFEISEFDKYELHPLKIFCFLTLSFNFHFEIFGIKVNDEQFSKILFKFYTFLVFHFEISGNSFNELHP